MARAQKIIRKSLEGLELLGKTAVQQVTGTGDYDTTPKEDKILPPEEKQKIKSQEAQMLAQLNQQIEAVRKKRQEQAQQAMQATQAKKTEKKQEEIKKRDKWAALKAMIKANQGSKEGSIRASG
jgi:TPP-dependent 2-oxoacid decarboxylase